jgi:hypothetical protein
MSKVKRNLDTEESREFWKLADETAAQVRAWPAWKRAGINVATERVIESAEQAPLASERPER